MDGKPNIDTIVVTVNGVVVPRDATNGWDYIEDKMHINPPVDPLFRVGEIGLGYDAESDLVVLVAREILEEGQEADDANTVRFWCTREQVRALARWGIEVVSRGRPSCPQCGEPINPEGHFCPKKNGHKH